MDDCILWTGQKWSQGRYGMDKINGKSMGAHKAAWIRKNGNVPNGMVVCHKCDNGLCVNTDHLFLGTMKENMQDCIKKNRFYFNTKNQKGKNNNNAKPELEIRNKCIQILREQGWTYSRLKKAFEIKSNGHLRQILKTQI